MNVSFLLNGAKSIKANTRAFQAECTALAQDASIHASVKAELLAAAAADTGKANTGLKEKGWNRLAEVVGMVSPTSNKLIDSTPANKVKVLNTFLKTGKYPSSRTNGAGGSIAVTDTTQAADLVKAGVWSLSKKEEGKAIREMESEVMAIIGKYNKLPKVAKPAATKPAATKPAATKPAATKPAATKPKAAKKA